MQRILFFCASLSLAVLLPYSSQASIKPPLKVLILTSPGVYHNYEQQTQALAYGIAEHVNVRFDVSLAELERWKTTDFAQGYDALIYNLCMADNQDNALIANLRRQTEQLGVPALVIHCTMHSFRETNLWWPMFGLQTKAHESLRPAVRRQHGDMVAMPYTQCRKAIRHAVNTFNRFAPGTRLSTLDQCDVIRLLETKFLQQGRQRQDWVEMDGNLYTVFILTIHKEQYSRLIGREFFQIL